MVPTAKQTHGDEEYNKGSVRSGESHQRASQGNSGDTRQQQIPRSNTISQPSRRQLPKAVGQGKS